MPPVIAIAGRSSSGKTTMVEKLISEISGRGYRTAAVKHSHHEIEFDQSHKDSWRHARAGAEETIVCAANAFRFIKYFDEEPDLEMLCGYFSEDIDIVIAEGFSSDPIPKIEVHRKDIGPLLENAANVIAIATDEPLDTAVTQFDLEDVPAIADLIVEKLIKSAKS